MRQRPSALVNREFSLLVATRQTSLTRQATNLIPSGDAGVYFRLSAYALSGKYIFYMWDISPNILHIKYILLICSIYYAIYVSNNASSKNHSKSHSKSHSGSLQNSRHFIKWHFLSIPLSEQTLRNIRVTYFKFRLRYTLWSSGSIL